MNDVITTPEYVLWAYRLLLGREPDTPETTRSWPHTSRREIVNEFLGSAEFLAKHSPRAWMAAMRDFWFIAELANGVRLWVRADDERVSRAVVDGTYEPAETAFVRRFVRRGMNVVDIGADIGWFTVNMATLVGPAGHVDAFEPRGDIAHYLQRTVAENRFANVAIHRCALSAQDGYGVMLGADAREPDGEGEGTAPAVAQQVPLRRLDSVVWGSVHFIRVDAGGAEKLVFEGADLILNRDRPLILAKLDKDRLLRVSGFSAGDFVRYFAGIDYQIRRILPGGRCGEQLLEPEAEAQPGPLSVACVPEEKAAELSSGRRLS